MFVFAAILMCLLNITLLLLLLHCGKSLIHTAGKETTGFGLNTPQDDFLESMAEAAKAVADYVGDNIIYINDNLIVYLSNEGEPSPDG